MKFYHAIWCDPRPFEPYFPNDDHVSIEDPKELTKEEVQANGGAVLVIWGGQDISPALYNRPKIIQTAARDFVAGRDAIEIALVQRAAELGIPIFGICRGAQLLCAASGGILVQDVSGHAGMGHLVQFKDGQELPYNTLHHQMMYPWDIEHDLLAWTKPRSFRYLGITKKEASKIKVEPEIVWFPKIKGFAVQGHPEMMNEKHPSVAKTMELFREKAL